MQTLQPNRRIRKEGELSGRRGTGKKREEKTRTHFRHANGFLKQRFGPVMDIGRNNNESLKCIEESFYHSLKNLAQLYKFEPLLNPSLPYPLNIKKSFHHAEQYIGEKGSNIQLIIYQDYKTEPSLATVKELDTNLTLFYIPIDPLWKLQRTKNKPAFDLLLSVFAYLHQMADMPLFNDDNYVGSTCNMIFEQVEEDQHGFDEDELKNYRTLAGAIQRVAPILNKEIGYPKNLHLFESRVNAFEPKSDFEDGLLHSAKAFLNLYQSFPGKSFMENLSCGFLYFNEDELSSADQYFSFCWTLDGWLMDNLDSYVNSDLQERTYLDQPCSVQFFSKRQVKETHGFEFHQALMEQLNLLVDTISMLP